MFKCTSNRYFRKMLLYESVTTLILSKKLFCKVQFFKIHNSVVNSKLLFNTENEFLNVYTLLHS